MSEEDLLKEERLQPLRKKLLTSALTYYEDFIKQRANDATVREELAAAYLRASTINWTVGMNKEGQKQAERAVELYEELLKSIPRPRSAQVAGRQLWLFISPALSCWRDQGALASYGRAIDLLEPLSAEDPSDVPLARELTYSYSGRAQKGDAGDPEGVAADTRRSAEIFEKLLSTIPPEEKDKTLEGLAFTYYRGGELHNCLKAIEIFRSLKNDWNLRGALNNAGNGLIVTGLPARGEPLVREAEAIVRKAISQAPQTDLRLQYLEFPLGEVGESLFLQGKTHRARR